MKPIILLDIDGVVNHAKRFSSRYSEEFEVPLSVMSPFFTHVFDKCTLGKADLKMELQYVLSDWKWKGSVEDLLVYWFEGEINIDTNMLKEIKNLRARGIRVYAATDQETYRSTYMLDTIGLRTHFDEVFVSCDLGVRKDNPDFFKIVMQKTQVQLKSMLFWDDDPVNIEVAEHMGMQAHLFTTYDDFVRKLQTCLITHT